MINYNTSITVNMKVTHNGVTLYAGAIYADGWHWLDGRTTEMVFTMKGATVAIINYKECKLCCKEFHNGYGYTTAYFEYDSIVNY